MIRPIELICSAFFMVVHLSGSERDCLVPPMIYFLKYLTRAVTPLAVAIAYTRRIGPDLSREFNLQSADCP
jgi:hypothetical protein